MAPKANVVGVIPEGHMVLWNYIGAVPVPALVPIPVPVPIPLVPPTPTVVGIMLDYWWEHGFFGCGENVAHDGVNVQWRQFYGQHRS